MTTGTTDLTARYSWRDRPGDAVSVSMSVNSAPTRTANFVVQQSVGPHLAEDDVFTPNTSFRPPAITDVRTNSNYTLEAGYVNPVTGEPEYERMGRYWRTDYTYEGEDIEVSLASMEACLIPLVNLYVQIGDGGAYTWPFPASAVPTVRAWIVAVLDRALTVSTTVVQDHAPTYSPTTREGFGDGWGVQLWDAIVGVCQAAELRFYPDDNNVWRLRRPARVAGTPRARFTDLPGEANTIGPIVENLALADKVKAYIVTHEWTTASGAQQRIQGRGGNYTTSQPAQIETRSEPTTQARADAYARSRMAALNSAIHTVTFTAPMMPWLRPDDAIHVTRVDYTGNFFIMNIDFDITSATMTITARKENE
ncbi:hypothetical protein [Brachybacterium paraconglomeratum]|uniref:hypothetical protein n=1 Tax=Brachybacterium paraconglomeratum TaxID=173362 RepID=UPI0022B020DA|nr:hypothetical protein [Brachybacterium paraconglomeratum]MCZ4324755.1 hypothetical protein [Brachybacterium paraconglomeratum]